MNVYDFTVKAQDGTEVALSDYRGERVRLYGKGPGRHRGCAVGLPGQGAPYREHRHRLRLHPAVQRARDDLRGSQGPWLRDPRLPVQPVWSSRRSTRISRTVASRSSTSRATSLASRRPAAMTTSTRSAPAATRSPSRSSPRSTSTAPTPSRSIAGLPRTPRSGGSAILHPPLPDHLPAVLQGRRQRPRRHPALSLAYREHHVRGVRPFAQGASAGGCGKEGGQGLQGEQRHQVELHQVPHRPRRPDRQAVRADRDGRPQGADRGVPVGNAHLGTQAAPSGGEDPGFSGFSAAWRFTPWPPMP